MAAKGTVEAGAAMTNQYKLQLDGMPDTFYTKIGAIDSELVLAEMADQTRQSTGQVKPVDVDVEQYVHHTAELVALEGRFAACIASAPGHKADGMCSLLGGDGKTVVASWLWTGVIIKKRGTPELAAGDDGQGARMKWTFSIDAVTPI
jgi:hypothetical protein